MRVRTKLFLVPLIWLLCVAVCYLVFDLWMIWLARIGGSLLEGTPVIAHMRSPYGVGLALLSFLYGCFRVWKFHPVSNPRYLNWLKVSPWRSELPLPLGPLHLVWQDALLIGAVTVLGLWRWYLPPWAPITAFATGQAITACLPLAKSRRTFGFVATIAVGLPAMILSLRVPMLLCPISLLLLSVAQWGMRISLRAFPWPDDERSNKSESVGFPFNRLGPIEDGLGVPPGAGLIIGVLAGWWAGAIGFQLQTDYKDVTTMAWGVGTLLAAIRLLLYGGCYWSPLGPWARIRCGRLLIAGYDCVLLAPLMTLVVALALPTLCQVGRLPPSLALGACIACVLTIAIELGPTHNTWRLTGAHRIVGGR